MDDMTEDELFQCTCFMRLAMVELLELVRDDLEQPTSGRHHAVPADTQLLAALQFFSSGSFQWMVGRSCGLSQPSVSLAVEVAPHYITFPTDQQSLSLINNKLSFHSVARFPNVVGAIDCTHIAIMHSVVTARLIDWINIAWYVVSKTCDVQRSLSVMNL